MQLKSILPCFVLAGIALAATSQSSCKPLPSDSNWPSEEQWQALNNSISGRLQAPYPYGDVCHQQSAAFNDTACTVLKGQWTSSEFHLSDAWTSMYNDDTCIPDATSPCSTSGYPAYVIEARTAADVQAGVRFSNDTGVRLIVKGTGHDMPGRSAGPGALSIWTHLFTDINITMNDPIAVQNGAAASVKLGAGWIWGNVYAEMAKVNLTVIGGADPHVGVGGWTQGAGHGPVSSYYGLGADQVLEMEVVTADGNYRVINASSDADLFWAMRGGGPSTYAIMLSMTVKAYPQLSGVQYVSEFNTTVDSATFWQLAAKIYSQVPDLSDQGAMGYAYAYPDTGLSNSTVSGFFQCTFTFPNKTKTEVEAIMEPFETSLRSSPELTDQVTFWNESTGFDNFMEYWSTNNPAEAVGADVRYGSWLLDRAALTSNTTNLANTLQQVTPKTGMWIGHVVAGRGVRDANPVGGSNAVLPAWRQAYVHLLQPRHWTPLNATEKALETDAVREQLQPAIRGLAPNSGAYVNEANPSEPNWKQDYYGANYERLLQIKTRWDPHGVFWCKPCVGYDEWEIVPIDGFAGNVYERGIGQERVMLCKTTNGTSTVQT